MGLRRGGFTIQQNPKGKTQGTENHALVNHAFARGTPAIVVIFVVSRGLSSKALVLLVRTQIRHFRRFR